jgi:hypothetical protein
LPIGVRAAETMTGVRDLSDIVESYSAGQGETTWAEDCRTPRHPIAQSWRGASSARSQAMRPDPDHRAHSLRP